MSQSRGHLGGGGTASYDLALGGFPTEQVTSCPLPWAWPAFSSAPRAGEHLPEVSHEVQPLIKGESQTPLLDGRSIVVLEDNVGQKYCCGHFWKNDLPHKTKNSLICANHAWLCYFTFFFVFLGFFCLWITYIFCSQRFFLEIGRRQTISAVNAVF